MTFPQPSGKSLFLGVSSERGKSAGRGENLRDDFSKINNL